MPDDDFAFKSAGGEGIRGGTKEFHGPDIVRLTKMGLSHGQIANKLGVGKSAVRFVVDGYKRDGRLKPK